MKTRLSPSEKAYAMNQDPTSYGTFAEIGAGQEVARWFFRAGNASKTVAKTMSAYDMTFSDAIYGAEENNRYVCESRLYKMLAKEFSLLELRLGAQRGASTRFFAFANTVTSKRAENYGGGHGWLGVRFQHEPNAAPSDAVLHIRLLDRHVLDQQEAVGLVGVNLVYACLFLAHDPIQFVHSLNENMALHQVEIDMIHLQGPAFPGVDNRLLSVHLVEAGLTDAVIFAPDGRVVQPSDALYGKHLLVQRGRFRPVTFLHLDMLEKAKSQFLEESAVDEALLVPLLEITLNNLLFGGRLDVRDFLARVDVLGDLGFHVMISNYAEYHRLAEFFVKHTRGRVGVVMGVGHLQHIFDERYYEDYPGGLLAALGNLFRSTVKALVYPAHSLSTLHPSPSDPRERKRVDAQTFTPPEKLTFLYRHMLQSGAIEDIRGVTEEFLSINSEEVLDDIRRGGTSWRLAVPPIAANHIAERSLFGYPPGPMFRAEPMN
jgi:hypothetical protein